MVGRAAQREMSDKTERGEQAISRCDTTRSQVAAANPFVYPREFILSKSLSLRKVAQMVQGSLNCGDLLLGQNSCLGDKDFAKNSLGHKKRFQRQG